MGKIPMVYFARISPTKSKSIGQKSGWLVIGMRGMVWYVYLIPHGGGGGGGNYGPLGFMSWHESWDEVSCNILDPNGKTLSQFIILKLINGIFPCTYHI